MIRRSEWISFGNGIQLAKQVTAVCTVSAEAQTYDWPIWGVTKGPICTLYTPEDAGRDIHRPGARYANHQYLAAWHIWRVI